MELLKERCRFVYFLFVRRHSFYSHRGSRYIDRTRGFSLMFVLSSMDVYHDAFVRSLVIFIVCLLFSGFFGGSIFYTFCHARKLCIAVKEKRLVRSGLGTRY